MRKEVIYTLKNLYRADMNIYGYHFGKGEKSACIVGACRGNEIQQLYICSQLVRKLKELEERGAIVKNNEILVIPSVNPSSMNISKRFWPTDGYQPHVSGGSGRRDDETDRFRCLRCGAPV